VLTRIKICGITNVIDAVAAVDSGAHALGFMFFENSKRNISPDAAAEIIRELPPFVSKVGVFVNPTAEFVSQTIETTGIDTLQFHGEEPPAFCSPFASLKTIKAFRMRDSQSLQECLHYRDCAWLLDSHVDGAHGGTGVAFDWNLAVEAAKLSRMIILAGGLKVETVRDAVHRVRPYAVDVSSGVEASPGKKDHRKLREFIAAVHAADDHQ
jgi:phosphoribosylanthranilate isomerase